MKKATVKTKILSLLIMLTMLVGMMPLSGIVSYAVDSSEACEHVDDDLNGICDTCFNFLSAPDGEIHVGESVTKDIPGRNDGFLYLTFTPTVTDTYVIKTLESTGDPLVYVYDSNGNYIEYDDDGGEGNLVYLVVELSAGVTYYLAFANYYPSHSAVIKVHPFCNEHISSGIIDCLGTICAVCDAHFGEIGDHVPSGPASCIGITCSVCDIIYGEPDPDVHIDNSDDAHCDNCGAFAPNTDVTVTAGEKATLDLYTAYNKEFVKFIPEESGMYFIKSYKAENSYDPYLFIYDAAGKLLYSDDDGGEGYHFYIEVELEAGVAYYLGIYDREDNSVCCFAVKALCDEHIPSDTVNCLGTLCSVCEEYYGGSNGVHTPGDSADCRGTLCLICEEYYGESKGEHIPGDTVNCCGIICSVCYEYFGEGNGEHTPAGEKTCLGTRCVACWEYYGEAGEHTLEGETNCFGTRCTVCFEYFGEADYNHTDGNGDSYCDRCNTIFTDKVITVGQHTISLVEDEYVYYKFIPSESGSYLFTSNSSYDPKIILYDEYGVEIAHNDDSIEYNFRLEAELVSGEIYYLGFYEYDQDNYCPVTVKMVCNEHTPGMQNCRGYICTVCGEYFGENGDHTFSEFEYDEYTHWGLCEVCDEYYTLYHEYGLDGKCECGYFEHEHIFDSYDYDPVDHWKKCSICGLEGDIYSVHEYDEDGICVCGRQQLVGILFGDTLLSDGEYLDNNGNLSTSRPEGGYVYYKDGVLTLSDFSFAYDVDEGKALVTESDLEIVINGRNTITSENGDCIFGAFADITFSGEGVLFINALADYDSIDMYGATLTFNSANIFVKSGDHGIELDDGAVVINGGLLNVEAGDDGFDLGNSDITINDGMISLKADDNGIDVSEDFTTTVNGGYVFIYAEDYNGIETGDLVINGGYITINTEYEEGIFAYGDISINGGRLGVSVDSDEYPAIAFVGEISVRDGNEYEVIDLTDLYVLGFDGEFLMEVEFDYEDEEQKISINDLHIDYDAMLVYNGRVLTPEIAIYDPITESWLESGVDFNVILPEKEIKDAGVYEIIIIATGEYVGVHFIEIVVHHKVDINLGETIEADAYYNDDNVYSYVKFVPTRSATYAFTITSLDDLVAYFVTEDLEYNGERWSINNGVIYFELQLEAGKTYYIDIADIYDTGRCEVTVEIICNDHVGGEATYTECAVCEICGESYGEKLHCDHMCHKGGIYAIIWDIFDEIYDYFGIESECKCGEKH